MTNRPFPISDAVAIVGVGSTTYTRAPGTTSLGQLAVEACIAAIDDAGLDRADITGLCGPVHQASPQYVQGGLGLPELSWWSSSPLPFSFSLVDAANAVFAGACEYALVYQSQLRTVATSSSAAVDDPIRARPDPMRLADPHLHAQYYRPFGGRQTTYAGYMRRYMHEFGATRSDFARIAVSGRTNAGLNPNATLRDAITVEDYHEAPQIRDPMCVFDMDYIVDCSDAVVITTAARARDLPNPPVLLHAYSLGSQRRSEADTYLDISSIGQVPAARDLWSRSAVDRDDVDVVFPYDGFTIIALKWLESFGYCAEGEGRALLDDAWVESEQRLLIDGRVPLNPHGGSLSEGASQGAGHVREAVVQLRGDAGDRQVPDAGVALLGVGGLFFNSTALILCR